MDRQLLILDCDGTLMDSIGAWHEAETALMNEAGIALTKKERDELNALTLEEAGAFFHERFGIRENAQSVVDAILNYLLDYYRTRSEATRGALSFVEAMSEAGVDMCVLSSSPQSFLQAGLERGGFLPYIKRIISVEDLTMTKLETVIYEYVSSLFGISVENTWLFDDSWYALATARKAGCRTVGVYSADGCGTHEELARYSDIVVDTFDELDRSIWIG